MLIKQSKAKQNKAKKLLLNLAKTLQEEGQ